MRAALARGRSLICEEVADPVPAPGQALVKSLACGICGSDLHVFHTMAAKPAGAPVVFGHEYCAQVLESRRFKAGTRVVAVPYVKGAQGAELIDFSPNFPGGFAEKMVLMDDILLEVPNGLTPPPSSGRAFSTWRRVGSTQAAW
jgi:threonine dehydrogenase-like Zn-dependent dehydrogenase